MEARLHVQSPFAESIHSPKEFSLPQFRLGILFLGQLHSTGKCVNYVHCTSSACASADHRVSALPVLILLIQIKVNLLMNAFQELCFFVIFSCGEVTVNDPPWKSPVLSPRYNLHFSEFAACLPLTLSQTLGGACISQIGHCL